MNRVCEFRKRFQGAALIEDRKNIYYLTGFTGEGCALITENSQIIITDFRYVEQCTRQAPECRLETTSKDVNRESILKSCLSAENINELFVETGIMTVNAYRRLESALEGVKLSDLPGTVGEMRIVKSEEELGFIAKAAKISCLALEETLKQLKPGMTEKYACALLEHEMRLHDSEGLAFDTIVASGVNGSLPHAVPSDKQIQSGELLTFDFGASYGGYCSDCTRTVAIGSIGAELRKIYDSVYTAHMKALEKVKAGMVCKELDSIARDYLEPIYPGAFGHSLGHGVGLNIHEAPTVSQKGETVLVPGHVITIEPGVYIPNLGGCRIEDTVFVTEDGFVDPYTVSKQLIVV